MHLPASARAATPAARQGALTAAPCPRLPPAAAQQSCWRRLSSGRRSWASPPTPTFRGAHLCLLVGSQPQLCCHRALCRALSRRRHQSWASERRLAAATCRVVNPPTCRVVTPPPPPPLAPQLHARPGGGRQAEPGGGRHAAHAGPGHLRRHPGKRTPARRLLRQLEGMQLDAAACSASLLLLQEVAYLRCSPCAFIGCALSLHSPCRWATT